MDKKSPIRIKIKSMQYDIADSLFSELLAELGEDELDEYAKKNPLSSDGNASDVVLDMITDGTLSIKDERVEISYNETELTGMEGAITTVSFATSTPSLISMLRGGSVTTAMIFEPGVRHTCIYETPIMPFELCIYTLKAENTLLIDGKLSLDYIIEIKGAQAERTCFKMEIDKKEGGIIPPDEYDSL